MILMRRGKFATKKGSKDKGRREFEIRRGAYTRATGLSLGASPPSPEPIFRPAFIMKQISKWKQVQHQEIVAIN